MATVLFDATADTLVFGEDAVYETLMSDNFIGGSAVAIAAGSLRFTFSGTAIFLFGRMNRNDFSSPSTNSPRRALSPNVKEIFVDDTPIENNVIFPDQVAINLIYQLTGLSDSTHVLALSNISFVILDFIEVTAGNTTPLSGSTLLLNSSDSAISYEGNWIDNSTMLVDDAYQHRQPIGDATRDTSFGDASVTVSFAGTSISVLGTRHSDPERSFSPTIFVDEQEQPYHPPLRSGPNYPWFSSQHFSEGNHVLKIDLSGNTSGGHFSLEYITYRASFENLDTKSTQISPSVFIGIGIGVAVVLCGIVFVLVWWKMRRDRLRAGASRTIVTSSDNSGSTQSTHQDHREPVLIDPLVEKSYLQTYSARVLTPHDFSMVRASTGRKTPRTSTGPGPEIHNNPMPVPGLSYSQEQQSVKPLEPRRKQHHPHNKDSPHHYKSSQQSQRSKTSTETITQIRQLQDMAEQFRREIVSSGQKNISPDHFPTAVNGMDTGTKITYNGHMAEGSYGMRVQQLEELMRELRGGTAHPELGHDQVGTGHSATLSGLMEEIQEIKKNQPRGSERTPVNTRNAI